MQSPLDQAVIKLNSGDVVAMPTETVYGLAARIDSPEGIRKIFSTKQRPFFDPLIVHVSSKDMAVRLTTDWSPLANYLAEHFWPGPLTLVLPKSSSVDSMITSGLNTVGIRMPRHSLALSLIEKVGVPLAAPSANRFGRTSPTQAEHVRFEFPQDSVFILDGGPCEVGLESTVLHVQRQGEQYLLSVLRAGGISQQELERAFQSQKFNFAFHTSLSKKESPGHMKHHYMPEVPLVLTRGAALTAEQILEETRGKLSELPDEVEGVKIRKPANLQRAGELILPLDAPLAFRALYAELRRLGESGHYDLLYFRLKPEHQQPEWAALLDRLTKAASLVVN